MIRLSLLSMAVLAALASAAQAEPPLQVHLPRSIQVEGDALTLGAISVIRTSNETLAQEVAAIPMGRAPRPQEEIALDRATILGRLAGHGIPASQVQMSGADKVLVGRKNTVVPAEEIQKAAETLLVKDRPSPAGVSWRVCRAPKDLVVPAGSQVKLEAKPAARNVTGEAEIEVAAIVDGRRGGACTVVFRLAYEQREAVALVDIAAGAVLTPENMAIRTVLSDTAPPAAWTPPFGQVATQPLRAGAVVRPAQARQPQPATSVRRSTTVLMRIQGNGYALTALGQALDDGCPGQCIRVRNIDSSRVVMAKVNADGSVEPLLDEVKK
ncbi:MAG: flagellar basal body P-ring formation chaperone FlgA [Planctomycetota bacterium]|nr:flagellar basal body P-ring formation chaperone FlgA [Planctomycetota bacterium]